MATKVKGLFKGLKYFSQIFEDKCEEIQIGLPTDVKHVAHIGWDGPSTNSTPSWMDEFKASQDSAGQVAVKGISARDMDSGQLSLAAQEMTQRNDIPIPISSQAKKEKSKKSSRRQRSTEASKTGSPSRENGVRTSRRSRNSAATHGSDSPSHDLPVVPRLRKKKVPTTNSNDGGSSKSSRRPRSKGQNSLTDISLEVSENASPRHSGFVGGKASEIIPEGIRT